MWLRWIIWSGLAVLAGFTSWWLNSLQQELPIHKLAIEAQLPDYTLKDFASVHTDAMGQMKNRLTAKQLLHYPNSNTEVVAPDIMFYQQGAAQWHVESEHGQVSADNNEVWLLGHATIKRVTTDPAKRFDVLSQNLHVKLNEESAETQAPSTLLSATSTTEAMGMRIWMKQQRLELLSKVKGTYVFKK
ncbi:MAG: LPS export ABC transporter periplasmic protein LptC [Thiotrichaceae bacterium]